jgi:hypothetical protein
VNYWLRICMDITTSMYNKKMAYVSEINSIDHYIDKNEWIYIEHEPPEVKRFIVRSNHERHCHYLDIPICLRYKIQRHIQDIAELAEYCDIEPLVSGMIQNPRMVRLTDCSSFTIKATFCIRCGNYMKGANRSFVLPTKKIAIKAQCMCVDEKYYTEYIYDILQLIRYAKSNITAVNSSNYISRHIIQLRGNLAKYNDWRKAGVPTCPYSSLDNLTNMCYSDSDDDDDDNRTFVPDLDFEDEVVGYETQYISSDEECDEVS